MSRSEREPTCVPMVGMPDDHKASEIELKLRERERFLEDVFDSVQDGVSVLDAGLTIRRVNRKMNQWYARNAPLEGKKCYRCYHDADEPCRPCPTLRCLQTGETEREIVPGLEGSSAEWLELYSYPLKDGKTGEITGVVEFVRDITERVRLEEKMAQSEKMLSLGGLAAAMAHELNNPLAGVLQSLEVAQKRLSSELPKNERVAAECGTSLEAVQAYMDQRGVSEMMRMARGSARRAVEVVDNILSFSRPRAGGTELADLAGLLDRCVDAVSGQSEQESDRVPRGLEISREYLPGMARVLCEPGKLQQVFTNILSNAFQALAGSPRRAGEAPRVTLRLLQESEMARIEIEDNGPGMPEAVRKRIFEPYFTTKKAGSGTGLGLCIAYFIVTESHNGSLQVESAPGQGARFVIRLPLQSA